MSRLLGSKELIKEDVEESNRLSVCLLTYNHGHLIESTVRSVLAQDYQDFEFIISDDCSTDDTWTVLQTLAKEDQRIALIQTPHNLGMAANANYAVQHASGAMIALLHHDDLYRSDLLSKWVCILEVNPGVSFVFNSYAQENTEFVWSHAIQRDFVVGQEFLWKYLLSRWGCPVRGTALIRRSHWDQVGGMRIEFGLLADVDLWMRLTRIGDVGYVAEPLIIVRAQRPENYPHDYLVFSWTRKRILYEIHARNLIELRDEVGFDWLFRWSWFRVRLNIETTKWLAYAVVRRKPEMIRRSLEGETAYDFVVLRIARRRLVKMQKRKHRASK